MKWLEWEKRDELCKGIMQLGISAEEAKKILENLEDECLIEITPPQKEETPLQNAKIKGTRTGRFSGKSYKPGNIIINMKEAMGESVSVGLSSAASIGAIAISQPIIAVFTILTAVISIANLGKIQLDDKAALILAVLWENRRAYNQLIDVDAGLELINRYLESHNREKISEVQYSDLLEDLENIGSIVLEDEKIKLNEKVCITY